jgi:hypothetical protein
MADPQDRLTDPAESADSPGSRQRLLVVSPPSNRAPNKDGLNKDGRPITNLASVFSKFAEMQHLVGDQVIVLEESVQQQGQQLAEISAQLPDIKERINWLIASFYDENRETQSTLERLARQEAGLATLAAAVRGLCEAQAQWKQTLDQLLQVLGGARGVTVPAPPTLPG